MAWLPFSNSSNTTSNFSSPGGFEDPYRSEVVSERPIGIGLFEDDGFEIFDPRGLFSPRRRLSTEDARFSNEHRSQSHQLPNPSSDLSPPTIPNPHSKLNPSIHSSSSSSVIDDGSNDPFDPSLLIKFNPHQVPNPSLSPRPWSLITKPSSDHINSSPTNDDFIDLRPLDLRSKSLQPNSMGLSNLDSDPRFTCPVDSCPISPCSSLPFQSSPSGSISHDPSLNQLSSPPMIPRGRSTLRRFVFEARSPLPTSSSPDINKSSSRGPSMVPGRAFVRPSPPVQLHSHHHRPSPILTCRVPCNTRDSSLPIRLRATKSPDDLSASVSSLAYSEMASSPAVNFLSAFADSTVPVKRNNSLGQAEDLPGLFDEGDEVAGHVLGPVIGRGGFSIVREATVIETCQKVAVKIVRHTSIPSNHHGIMSDRSQNNKSGSVSPKPGYTIDHEHHPSNPSFRDRSSSTPVPFDSYLLKSTHLPLPTSITESLASALLNREIDIWSSLKEHPHIVPLLSVHRALHQTFIYMPLCDGGNLLQMLNELKNHESDTIQLSHLNLSQGNRWVNPSFRSLVESCRSLSSPIPPSQLQPSGLDLVLIRHIFYQVANGLKYLHLEAGVTHKDIKLENILIHDGKVKISDFGLAVYPSQSYTRVSSDTLSRDLSLPKHLNTLPRIKEGHISGTPLTLSRSVRERRRRFPHGNPPPTRYASFSQLTPPRDDSDGSTTSSDDVLPTAAGSLAYTPPEQLRSDTPLTQPSLDIWALGCVLYALLEGNLPFQDDFEPRLRLKIMNGQYAIPTLLSNKSMSELSEKEKDERRQIGELLNGCLAIDTKARWTIEDILKSDWMNPEPSSSSSSPIRTDPSGRMTNLDPPIERMTRSHHDFSLHHHQQHQVSPSLRGDDTPRPPTTSSKKSLSLSSSIYPSFRPPSSSSGHLSPHDLRPKSSSEESSDPHDHKSRHLWDPTFDLRHLMSHITPRDHQNPNNEHVIDGNRPKLLLSPSSNHSSFRLSSCLERSSRSITRDLNDRHLVYRSEDRRGNGTTPETSKSPSRSRNRSRRSH